MVSCFLTQQASLPVRWEFSMSWKLQFLTAPSLVVALFPVADLTMCQAKIHPPAIFGLHAIKCWPWFRAALVWVKWHHSQTSGLLCINVLPVANKDGKTRLEIQAGTCWSPFSVLSFRSDVEPKPLLQLLFKVENTSCHYHSQKNKNQSSTLTYRPTSPFPLEENGFCVKLSQPNPKPRDVCFRFCYKARTQAKFGKKRKKNLGKVSSISRPIYGFEWKPYSIHYFHRGLIWNQAQTGSFKLTFASSYTENQTQHIFPSIQAHRILIRRSNSQSPVL